MKSLTLSFACRHIMHIQVCEAMAHPPDMSRYVGLLYNTREFSSKRMKYHTFWGKRRSISTSYLPWIYHWFTIQLLRCGTRHLLVVLRRQWPAMFWVASHPETAFGVGNPQRGQPDHCGLNYDWMTSRPAQNSGRWPTCCSEIAPCMEW